MTCRTNFDLFYGGNALRIGKKYLATRRAMTNPKPHFFGVPDPLPLLGHVSKAEMLMHTDREKQSLLRCLYWSVAPLVTAHLLVAIIGGQAKWWLLWPAVSAGQCILVLYRIVWPWGFAMTPNKNSV